jgi:hypothetical protein
MVFLGLDLDEATGIGRLSRAPDLDAAAVRGLRWWFVCPLIGQGRTCARRVGKLYLPPGSRYFGCRHCHELTYTSCQESRKHDSLFRHLALSTGMDFLTVKRAMDRLGKPKA